MLARQCGRHGRAQPLAFLSCSSQRFQCPLKDPLPIPFASIWVTDELLRREFQLFFYRKISSSHARCEFDSEDYSRRLMRRRMSMVRAEAIRHDQFPGMGMGKWDETPPTFSWSLEKSPETSISDGSIDPKPEPPVRPRRPMGVHYQLGDTGSTMSHFLRSIFQPVATFFPTRPDELLPPPPPPLTVSMPSSAQKLSNLEAAILDNRRSLGWILRNYREFKKHSPYLQLCSRAIVSLFQRLLDARMYSRFLEVLEGEDVVAVEAADLIWLSLEGFEDGKTKRILGELYAACDKQRRERFREILEDLEIRLQKDLHTAVLKKTAQMMSQILVEQPPKEEVFATEIAEVTDAKTLCDISRRIIISGTKIGVETSQKVFQRFIDLGSIGDSIQFALNPSINVPGTNNIAKLCNALCDGVRYREGYRLIMAALKVNGFGFLSDLDVRVGIRTIDQNSVRKLEELVELWEAVNSSEAISIRDIRRNTFATFLGRACRFKFGSKSQWREGKGVTALLKMCIEIIVLRLRDDVNTNHLATLVETWIWNWNRDEVRKINIKSLEKSIPFMSNFFDVLSQEQVDRVFTVAISRITVNCQRKGDEVFPMRILWPLLASVAQSRLWQSEESIALWVLEGTILRKGLASKYLAFRSDPEIARFVVRHYLPFRMAIEGSDDSTREKAEKVFARLRRMEEDGVGMDPDTRSGIELGIERLKENQCDPFATAILAFKGTGIPCRTLLLDMIYTLYRLGRPLEIVHMLHSLNDHGIRPSSSQYAHLIRTMTAQYPKSALAILKIYAKSQYSTFASYIATVASKYPHLAISAYRFLTRPNKFPFTPDQPCIAPRRLPKRRLLVAMAWKFANSPALTARQCQRWVHICYGTMLKLGYAPGPTMGLAVAVAAVQRTIREGIPVRISSARQKWVLQVVKRQVGKRKAEEVAGILKKETENRWGRGRRERLYIRPVRELQIFREK